MSLRVCSRWRSRSANSSSQWLTSASFDLRSLPTPVSPRPPSLEPAIEFAGVGAEQLLLHVLRNAVRVLDHPVRGVHGLVRPVRGVAEQVLGVTEFEHPGEVLAVLWNRDRLGREPHLVEDVLARQLVQNELA